MIGFLECFQQKSDLLGGPGRVKTDQTDSRARSENRDHDRFFVDRVHDYRGLPFRQATVHQEVLNRFINGDDPVGKVQAHFFQVSEDTHWY